jgi:hypothetical protein
MFAFLAAAITLIGAALLEITGDRKIADALRPFSIAGVLAGWGLLGLYGVAVNAYNAFLRRFGPDAAETWEFSKLIGVYISVFAAVNLFLALRRDDARAAVSGSTIAGTIVVLCGGAIIQFGDDIVRLCRSH